MKPTNKEIKKRINEKRKDPFGIKARERIYKKRSETDLKEKNQTPSQATRQITPGGYKNRDIYVYSKMGSLIRASKKWLREPEINKFIIKREEALSELKEKIKAGDDNAIFELIQHNFIYLADPLVLKKIEQWQNEVISGAKKTREKSRRLLEKIGSSLIPSMKGIRKNTIREPEEVLKYFWMKEWSWFYMLKYLYERDWLTKPNRKLDDQFKKKCEEYFLKPNDVKDILEKHIEEELEPNFSRIAAYETGCRFNIDEETVLGLITKYDR